MIESSSEMNLSCEDEEPPPPPTTNFTLKSTGDAHLLRPGESHCAAPPTVAGWDQPARAGPLSHGIERLSQYPTPGRAITA
eukprot:710340-Hanusia_phi.AAC.1